MEIWDSLNRRYLDFIKKRGAQRVEEVEEEEEEVEEESWLFRGLLPLLPLPLLLLLLLLLREPGRGRAEELVARRALVPGSGFLPKKGKAGKKSKKAAARGAGEPRPRDGELDGRRALATAPPGAAGPPPESQSPEPRAAGPDAGCAAAARRSAWPPGRAPPLASRALRGRRLSPCSPWSRRRRPRTPGLRRGPAFRSP